MTSLNVGAGQHPLEGWLNVDAMPEISAPVDLVGALPSLPFRTGVFERAYLGHILEHLWWGIETTPALLEIRRVVRRGGTVMVVGPCIGKAVEQDAGTPTLRAIVGDGPNPLGWNNWNSGGHRWVATEAMTFKAMQLAGLEPDCVPIGTVHHPDWPNVAPEARWQTALRAVNPGPPLP